MKNITAFLWLNKENAEEKRILFGFVFCASRDYVFSAKGEKKRKTNNDNERVKALTTLVSLIS